MIAHVFGAGIAGYASALSLARLGFQVIIYDQSNHSFAYSSSKNSAIARSYEADPYLSRLLKLGIAKMIENDLVKTCSLFICPMEYDYYEEEMFIKKPDVATEIWSGLQSVSYCIDLPNNTSLRGRLIPQNGTLDLQGIQEYLRHSLEQYDVKCHYVMKLTHLEANDHFIKEIQITHTRTRQIHHVYLNKNDILVNACGSWSREVMRMSHLNAPMLIPHKRHMFILEDKYHEFTALPIIWNEIDNFYVRPYEDNILVSYCDEEPKEPSDYFAEHNALIQLKHVLSQSQFFSFLQAWPVLDYWSCLRTFPLDNRPVIGFDSYFNNVFWCAGLGGRGMSLSLILSDIILPIIEQKNMEETELNNPFTTHRLNSSL